MLCCSSLDRFINAQNPAGRCWKLLGKKTYSISRQSIFGSFLLVLKPPFNRGYIAYIETFEYNEAKKSD